MKIICQRIVVVSVLAALLSTTAHADGFVSSVSNAKWQAECSACHVAYPPHLLGRESWRAIMSGLNKHFGSDASLEPAAAREIGAFLEKNSGNQASTGVPDLRISKTRWFLREHDEVSQKTWQNPKVKSPANCTACHTQAASGNFSEHSIHIPR
jgi:hypothetical protein